MNNKYIKAQNEWNDRLGSADKQIKNWKLAFFSSLVIVLLLSIAFIMTLMRQQNFVYIAEVKTNEQIANVHPILNRLTATKVQEEAFVSDFIKNIMNIPLDPVVLQKQWVNAFSTSEGRAKDQLNQIIRKDRPFKNVGQITREIKLINFNALSDHTYEFNWEAKTYARSGKEISSELFHGSFTVKNSQEKPVSSFEALQNPFNLKIAYFDFSKKG